MVREVAKVQPHTKRPADRDDVAKLLKISRRTVGSQAHDLVFVAKFAEAEVLRHCCIKHAEGMGERNSPRSSNLRTLAHAPHCAGEVAEAVGGKHRRALEWRDKESAGQMGAMMFDAMKLRANRLRVQVQRGSQFLLDSSKTSSNLGAFHCETRHAQRKAQLRSNAGPGVARNGNVID